MVAQSPPFALQNASHAAALFRQAAFSAFHPRGGVLGQGDYTVSAQSTPNMSVQVAAGRSWMPGSQVANVSGGVWNTQAGYFGINDAAVTVSIAAANATNPRIDVVYVATNDQFYSGTLNTLVVGVVTGTPAASPVAPSAPNNSVVAAQVTVPANATSIVSGNIANIAIRAGAVGGIMVVGGQLERDFIPGVTKGFAVYRMDTLHIEVYNGTTWDQVFPSFTLDPARIQVGKATANISGANNSTGTVTFPTAFASAPVVILTVESDTPSVDLIADINAAAPTTTSFPWRLRERSGTTGTYTANLHWIAVMP